MSYLHADQTSSVISVGKRSRTSTGQECHVAGARKSWEGAKNLSAVILVLVVGTIRLVGSNANKVFSSVASSFTNEGWGQPTSWIYSQQLHTDPQ